MEDACYVERAASTLRERRQIATTSKANVFDEVAALNSAFTAVTANR